MARGKTPVSIDLPRPTALACDASDTTKQEIVYNALRRVILEERVLMGAQMPSTRTLAERWQISRGIVEVSYDRLCSEGYLTRIAGSGTFVKTVVPDSYFCVGTRPLRDAKACDQQDQPIILTSNGPSHRESEIRVCAGIPFVARLPDPALFTLDRWARHAAKAVSAEATKLLDGTDPMGLLPLRERISTYLRQYRDISCSPHDVIITSGIRHSIDLVARALLRRGDKTCVEDPFYPSARDIFRMSGAEVEYVPVDNEGIEVGELHRHPNAKLVYVTPAHQSPLGVTMSVDRRLELLDWAKSNGAWIIEDDYDSEFSYAGAPLPALTSLDQNGLVLYCGSFNKTIHSELRIGFVVARGEIRERIWKMSRVLGRSVPFNEQVALNTFMKTGAFARHLRVARQAYSERKNLVLHSLSEIAGDCYSVSGEHAGLHFVLWLPQQQDEARFCAHAAAVGLTLQRLSTFCQNVRLAPAVIVGFTALKDEEVRISARKLANVLRNQPLPADAAARMAGVAPTSHQSVLVRYGTEN